MSLRASAIFAVLLGLLAPCFAAAQAASSAAAPVINLYAVPDAGAPALIQLKGGDAAFAATKPAADPAKAAAGWVSVTLSQNVTGYAPTNTSRKDLSIRPGTPIHQLPKSDSPIIGVATDSPVTSVEAAHGDWLEVTYPGPEVLYYQQINPVRTPPPVSVPASTPVAAPTPEPESVATPVAGTSAGSLPRYYIGVLKLRTNPLTRGPANAQYILVGNDGQLLALVDLGNIILPGPADNYLGKSVRVYGASEPANDSLVALIKAQLLQLN